MTETTVRKRIPLLIGENLVNVVAVPTPTAVGMTMSATLGISVQLPTKRLGNLPGVTGVEIP